MNTTVGHFANAGKHVLVPHQATNGHVSLTVVCAVAGLHILAGEVLQLYLRLYYSRNVYEDSLEYGGQHAQQMSDIGEVILHGMGLGTILLPTPLAGANQHQDLRRFMHECDDQKNPLQCWRDRCKGHYLSPRPSLYMGMCLIDSVPKLYLCAEFNSTIRMLLITGTCIDNRRRVSVILPCLASHYLALALYASSSGYLPDVLAALVELPTFNLLNLGIWPLRILLPKVQSRHCIYRSVSSLESYSVYFPWVRGLFTKGLLGSTLYIAINGELSWEANQRRKVQKRADRSKGYPGESRLSKPRASYMWSIDGASGQYISLTGRTRPYSLDRKTNLASWLGMLPIAPYRERHKIDQRLGKVRKPQELDSRAIKID